jgi:hypothetical protein
MYRVHEFASRAEQDLARLEQIVSLKFLCLPKPCWIATHSSFPKPFAPSAPCSKKLDRAIEAIAKTEQLLQSANQPVPLS